MIGRADEKVRAAAAAMQGADSSANLALTDALVAQKIAEEASEKAAVISSESGESLEKAQELASSAESLANKLSSTKDEIERKEQVADRDGKEALQVIRNLKTNIQNSEPLFNEKFSTWFFF